MRGITRFFLILILAGLVVGMGGRAVAQAVELKTQVLGTEYNRESRTIGGELPDEGAVVKRAEGVRVFCLTAFASETETVVYHVWLYRGDEESGLPAQVFFYDSLTKESRFRPLAEGLAQFADLGELADIRAGAVMKLRVGESSYFRTYSVKRIDIPPSRGAWECRVYDASGKLLGKKTFTVTAG